MIGMSSDAIILACSLKPCLAAPSAAATPAAAVAGIIAPATALAVTAAAASAVACTAAMAAAPSSDASCATAVAPVQSSAEASAPAGTAVSVFVSGTATPFTAAAWGIVIVSTGIMSPASLMLVPLMAQHRCIKLFEICVRCACWLQGGCVHERHLMGTFFHQSFWLVCPA